MPRQPAHITEAGEFPVTRQAMWDAIRKLEQEQLQLEKDGKPAPGFTKVDLAATCQCKVETVRTYLTGLTNAGFLKLVQDGKHKKDKDGLYVRSKWRLVKNVGIDAPRVNRSGEETTLGACNKNLWRTMRTLKTFTARDLAVNARTTEVPLTEATAEKYIQYLVKAHYISVLTKGHGRTAATYLFIEARYSGPKPPKIQRLNQVYDPNTKKVMWQQTPKVDE